LPVPGGVWVMSIAIRGGAEANLKRCAVGHADAEGEHGFEVAGVGDLAQRGETGNGGKWTGGGSAIVGMGRGRGQGGLEEGASAQGDGEAGTVVEDLGDVAHVVAGS
jgi:hypothetical protein